MSKYYEDAVSLSRMITEWVKTLKQPYRFAICSGGGPGIMEAANKGAYLAKGRTIGFNVSLPFEQKPNPYISEQLDFEFHYFFMRKFWFVYLAKAFIMFPGGFGTMDELMEVLTLVQTQKLKKKVTILLYGKKFWSEILNFDAMLKNRVISREDLKLFEIVETPEEAFKYLVKELKKNYPLETAV
ncbi:MAG: TIGR00730 family Rossman fold protein [Bacteroidetes bacterium]|nr:TIGR00730 family Rossman fold protein [Bacteroidota bacterium]